MRISRTVYKYRQVFGNERKYLNKILGINGCVFMISSSNLQCKSKCRSLEMLLPSKNFTMLFFPLQVYDAAVRWLKYDEPNRQPFMVDILAKVRFPLISKNFLSKTVQAEPLIQDNPECLKMVISKLPYCPFIT